MDPLSKLEEIFRHFPGIGPRQAKRFAYFLLTKSDADLAEFSKSILELKKSVSMCSLCQRFFPIGNKVVNVAAPICSICSDPNRDTDTLMIVGRDIDLQAVERSRAYNGLYFVLGGSVPIFDEAPDQKIRQKELMARLEQMTSQEEGHRLKEVILATSVNPEGEHTASYIAGLLKPLVSTHGFRVSTLGRGLSTGTELEYSDSETLKSALQNRR
ncbi:MAG: recombination protein RecR [Patescibacteria group bacterium]|nr:recombination protein RecR [Patescibacteria group bacterium]